MVGCAAILSNCLWLHCCLHGRNCRYQSGDNQKAIEVYEYFVEHNPRSGTLINNMISVYHKLGREEMAAYHNWLVPTLQVRACTSHTSH